MSEFTERLRRLGRESVTQELPPEDKVPPEPARPSIDVAGLAESAVTGTVKLGAKGARNVSDATTGFIQGQVDRQSKTNKLVGPREQLEIDKNTLPPGKFALKYGKAAERARDFEPRDVTPNESVRTIESFDDRTLQQKAGDAVVGTLKGGANIAVDLTSQALRAGLITGDAIDNNDIADFTSDVGTKAVEAASTPLKSRELLSDTEAAGRAQAARMADSAEAFKNSDGSLREQFRRIGRDSAISMDTALKYGAPTSNTVWEGFGSVLPSLAVAGGAKAGADIVLKTLGIEGLTAKAAEAITTAAAVGIMEGSSAYNGARQTVMEMKDYELRNESPVYNELRAQGMSHEDAQKEVARQAGTKAQVLTTLVAAGISLPFTGFEGGAFSRSGRRTLLSVGSDIAGQTVEEASQGASGQYFQNLGVKDVAKESQDITAGVGEGLTQGAIGGLGATGIMSSPQAPGLYIDKMKQLGSGLTNASIEYIGKPLGKKKALQKGNQISDDFAKTLDGHYQAAAEVIQKIDAMDAGEEVDPETRAALEKARAVVEPLKGTILDTNSDEYRKATKKFGNKINPSSKTKTLENMFRAVTNGEFGEGTKLAAEASEFVMAQYGAIIRVMNSMVTADAELGTQPTEEQVASLEERVASFPRNDKGYIAPDNTDLTQEQKDTYNRYVFNEDQAGADGYLTSVLKAKTPDATGMSAQQKADTLVANMDEVPVFAKGLKKASEVLNEESAKSVEAGGPIKPIQSFAEVVMNPVGVDPARITDDVKKQMPEDVLRAVAVVEAIQAPEHSDRLDPVKGNRTNDATGTREEILFRSKSLKRGTVASFNDMVSQLLRGAIRNKREGTDVVKDTEGKEIQASDVWTDLQQLVKHQQNKFNAAKESYEYSKANPEARDTRRQFDALSQKSGEFGTNNGSIFVKAGNENSTTTFRNIAEDLNTGIRAINALIEQFPEMYQGEKLQEVPLPEIEGVTQRAETPQATKPAAKPAATAEPSQSKQAEPAEVVADPVVDNGPSGNNDGLRPDQISFKELFNGGTETTFADALLYMMGLSNLNPGQQDLLSLLAASGFARANAKTIVREATAAEKAKAVNSHGWWDGKKNEIVLIEPRISKLQHEMIHAATLEVLAKNLASAFLARAAGKPLSKTEEAAIRLNDAAVAFMADTSVTGEGLEIQAIMQDLLGETKPGSPEEQRAMVRVISEYMAYGLTETDVRNQLEKKVYKFPEIARKVGKAIGELLVGLLGNRQRDPATSPDRIETALDRLFFDTETLALQGKPSALKSRAVKGGQNAKTASAQKAADQPAAKKAAGKKDAEGKTEAKPDPVAETAGERNIRHAAERDVLVAEFKDIAELVALRKNPEIADSTKLKKLEARKEKFDDEMSDLLKRQKAERDAAKAAQAEVSSAPAETKPDTVQDSVTDAEKQEFVNRYEVLEKAFNRLFAKPDKTAEDNKELSSLSITIMNMGFDKYRQYKKDLGEEVLASQAQAETSAAPAAEVDTTLPADDGPELPAPKTKQPAAEEDSVAQITKSVANLLDEVAAKVKQTSSAPVTAAPEVSAATPTAETAVADATGTTAAENASATSAAPELVPMTKGQVAAYERDVKLAAKQSARKNLSDLGRAKLEKTLEDLAKKKPAYDLAVEGKKTAQVEPTQAVEPAPKAEPVAKVKPTKEKPVQRASQEEIDAALEALLAEEQMLAAMPDEQINAPAPEPAPVEEVREIDQDVGLPEDWKPTRDPLKTLFGNNGSSFMSQIIKFLEPKLQPGDTLNRLIEYAAPSLGYNVTPEMKAANKKVVEDVGEVLAGMQAAVAKRFETLKDHNGNMLAQLQAFQKGGNRNPIRSAKHRYMAWLDGASIERGVPQFDSHLLSLALLATADFVMNTETGAGKYKPKDILKILGLKNWGVVTSEMIDSVNAGRPGSYVKDALAAHIREFMGAQVNNDMSQSETDGVFEALAHEILDYLSTRDANNTKGGFWMKSNPLQVFKRTVTIVSFGKPTGWQGDNEGKRLLRDVLTSRSSDMHRYSIGSPWPEGDVALTLRRNQDIKTSKQQREATAAEQNTPYYFSKDFWEMYEALLNDARESEAMAFVLGWRNVEKDKFYNAMDKASVQGKNASVKYGIKNAMQQIREIQAYAEKHGLEPHEVPVYYRIAIGANTRSNFEGYNPKGDKFAREMFSPTRHTVDLTDKKAVIKLYAAIAQALGEKVEDLGLEDAATKAKELLEGKFAKVLGILETGNLKDARTRQDFALTIAKEGLEEEGAFTLKALWVAKKLKAAIANGDTEFETDMYMELDGKTNGPIAAAIQHFLGQYSPEILATWRRGGYFLNNAGNENDNGIVYSWWKKTFNEADFYGRVGQLMGKGLLNVQDKILKGDFFAEEAKDEEQRQAWAANGDRAFQRLMSFLGETKGISVERVDGELSIVINRGATKSPITQNLYGAGLRSISLGMAGDFVAAIYSDLTKLGQGDTSVLKSLRKQADQLEILLQHDVIYDEFYQNALGIERTKVDGPSLRALLQSDNPSKELMAKFKFSEEQFERLATNTQAFYLTAFKEALDTAVDPSVAALNKRLIKGAQTHGKIYKRIVDKALRDKHAELVKFGVIFKTQELPKNVRRQVLKQFEKLNPVIENDFTSFSTLGSEKESSTEVANRIFGQEKAKEEGKDVEIERPFNPRSKTASGKEVDSLRAKVGEARSRILALLTQTNSDVRLQIEAWTNPKYPKNALGVYDGNNHATTDLEAASEVMNEAMGKAWHTNTLRGILEAYQKALEFDDGAEDFDDLRSAINELERDVIHRDARIEVEKRIFTSFQGVPGADVPFTAGELRFENENELIRYLNTEVELLISKKISDYEKNLPKGKKLNAAELKTTYFQGVELPKPKKPFYVRSEVYGYLNELISILEDPDDIEIVQLLMKSEAFKGMVENYFVLDLRVAYEGVEILPQDEGNRGVYYLGDNIAKIFDKSAEVAIHELLHAATTHQVHVYYTTPQYLSASQREIVRGIEELTRQFVEAQNYFGFFKAPGAELIRSLWFKGDRQGAVSEFISYGLTNPELRTELSTVGVYTNSVELKKQVGSVFPTPILRLFDMMKSLIGKMFGFPSRTKTLNSKGSFLDNLKYHTRVLAGERTPKYLEGRLSAVDFSTTNAADLNLEEASRKFQIQKKIGNQVTEFLKARFNGDASNVTAAKRAQNAATYAKAKNAALDAMNTMAAAGFTIDGAQDTLLFQTLHAVIASDTQMDKIALQELQQIYNAVIEKLGTDSFRKYGPGGQAGELQSIRMYAAVLGQPFFDVTGAREFLPPRGPAGVERLASFIALAQVSPELRDVLSEIDMSSLKLSTAIDTKNGLDGVLGSVMDKATNRLTGRILESKGKQGTPSVEVLDTLTSLLMTYDAQAAVPVERAASNVLRGVNDVLRQGIEGAGAATADALSKSAQNASSDLSKAVQELAAGMASLLVDDRATVTLDSVRAITNKPNFPEYLRNLFAEARGINLDTVGVLKLVKKAKDDISRMRQEYIDQVPQIIRKSFGPGFEKLKGPEKKKILKALFKGLGKTDFGALDKVLGSRSAIEFFGTDQAAKSALQSEIRQMKASLAKEVDRMGLPKNIELAYIKKAEQLADYMINKKVGENLLTNAVSILNLHNEDGYSITEAEYKQLQDTLRAKKNERGEYTQNQRRLIDTIDALASLEAIGKLDDETHKDLSKFLTTNRKAVLDAIDYQRELHRREHEKVSLTSLAALNGIKGHFTTNSQHKHTLMVANNADEQLMREQGFTKMRAFNSPIQKFDPNQRNQSYYFSAHHGLATYNQGAMQTVQDTFFGTDPTNGMVIGSETTSRRVTGKEMSLLNKRMKAAKGQAATEDGLIPRFGSNGKLIGLEEAVSNDMFEMLNQTNDYADSLGRWAGRIEEEKASHGLNYELIDAMKAQFDKDKAAGNEAEYARFGREQKPDGSWDVTEDLEKDPIWRESYFLMPKDAREYAEEVFGGPIRVRRDMINNAFGFRSMSVADVFTGKSRLSEETREAVKNVLLATPILGKDAFKYLTVGEELLQGVVSGVKHIIVVKSGVVMVANTISNVLQLASREVPLSYIAPRTRSKWAELERYKQNEDLKIQLRYDYLRSKSNSERANIKARENSIDEANKKMSIWPLIQANQFTTISEGLTDDDRAMFSRGFGDWIEKKAGELPGPLSTVARYALVAKDTALYQGLAKGVQYSDFISKAIYYDFLTQERGMKEADVLLKIDQEFINYDLNDSRMRSMLEANGLTWFMNFKIRSLKIGLDMMKNNPASVLLSLTGAGFLGLDSGTPVTDNLAAVIADGRIWYSTGFGMMEAGWSMNFWNQLFGSP